MEREYEFEKPIWDLYMELRDIVGAQLTTRLADETSEKVTQLVKRLVDEALDAEE